MARPQKEGLDYFPHDCDAFNDEKIEALVMLHGPIGYMFYFVMLERIYRTKDFELKISDAETKQIFARKLSITTQEFDSILFSSLKWGCFDEDAYKKRGVLTSNGIKKRANVVVKKRNKMRSEYGLRISDAETKQKLTRNSSEKGERKEKKSKVNNIYNPPYSSPLKKNNEHSQDDQCSNEHSIPVDQCSKIQGGKIKYAEFVSMTNDEYSSLVAKLGDENKVKRCIEILDNYKGANGKKYKSDYRAILNWVITRLHDEESKNSNNPENQERREMIKSLYLS